MKFAETAFEPFTVSPPSGPEVALVCDSPHSGVVYPADFQSCLPASVLRGGEGTSVEELWRGLPRAGASLLAANFPRTYIDVDYEADDMDSDMLAEPWTTALHPGADTRRGRGLIWRLVRGHPIYDRKLWVAELENRIGTYYEPYRAQRDQLIESAFGRFGQVWHIGLRCQPLRWQDGADDETGPGPADFVLADLGCDRALPDLVQGFLESSGHTVARFRSEPEDLPPAEAGKPDEDRHSLQIGIDRRLYMDEQTYEKTVDFVAVQGMLDQLGDRIARYVRNRGVGALEET